MRMQISYKPVVQACHYFIFVMYTFNREQIYFKFLFI